MNAQDAGMLTGTVFEPQGATVRGAEIALRWNDAGPPMR